MLVIRPWSVTLLGKSLHNVEALTVDRLSGGLALERSDKGPHVVFADAPEQRVVIRVRRQLTADEATPARAGEAGELRWTRSAGTDAGSREFVASVVVERVEHELSARAGAAQRIEMVAISMDGAADPVTEVVS